MIEVQVHLYSILREQLPPGNRGSTKLSMPEEATIADLLSDLQIDRPVVVVVNKARVRDRKQILHGGDSVAIFPPVAGG